MDPAVSIETITPKKAAQLLELNTANFRNVDFRRVARYAKDMSDGSWDLTGDTIKFNGTHLLDGQHRLHACVKSGVSFETVVVRGASGALNIDRGKPRTVAQWLKHNGVPNYNRVAAMAKCCLAHQKHSWHLKSWPCDSFTDREIVEFALQYQAELVDASKLSAKQSVVSQAMLGAVLFLGCGKTLASKDEICVWFSDGMATGKHLSETDAVLYLRNKFLEQRNKSTRVDWFMQRQLVSKAWNMTVLGQACNSAMSMRMRFTGPNPSKLIEKVLTTAEAT